MKTTIGQVLEEKGNEIYTISPEDTVQNALKKMSEKGVGALMVMLNDKIVGVFSERDFARKAILKDLANPSTKVSQMMSRQVYYMDSSRTMIDCMTLMTEKRVRHLPVIENDAPVGIISIGDVVNSIIKDQKSEIHDLENYITGGGYGA